MNKIKFFSMLLAASLVSGCWETEKGEKIGTIVKIGKVGFLIKTNEAELIRGGINNGNGGFGVKPFDFTIENEGLLAIANDALEKQKTVRIKYHKEFATLFRTETSDNAFLDGIEIIN